MPTVSRQIEVLGSPPATSACWSHFVDAVVTGRQRLACDELACTDAVHRGNVAFATAGGGATTVVFSLEADGAGPPADLLGKHLVRDLVVFKDYVERGGHQVGLATPAEKKALLEDDERRGHHAAQPHISRQSETAAYVNRFPT